MARKGRRRALSSMADDVVHCYVSLFSGGGFGDIGISYGAGIPLVACCEKLVDLADVLRRLFPAATVFCDDIWICGPSLAARVREHLGAGKRPLLLLMSPPCQGMSSNGVGRIMAQVSKGARPRLDPRNRLILPALDIVDELQPEWVVIENVRNMRRTVISNERDEVENVIDMVRRRLANYVVQADVVDAASHGVPQRRTRLITICKRRRREEGGEGGGESRRFHPPPTHGPRLPLLPYVTLADATRHLGPLDARARLTDAVDALHRIPRWTELQHFAMRHTPEGATAFDNDTCARCGTKQSDDGSSAYCSACDAPLPRPVLVERTWTCGRCSARVVDGQPRCADGHARTDEPAAQRHRVIRAFKTSYRRMRADRPASTLTTNSGVISSDVKGHPTEHRVLSLREVLIVASVCDPEGRWSDACAIVESLDDRRIRHIAGESIPPRLTHAIARHLVALSDDSSCDNFYAGDG